MDSLEDADERLTSEVLTAFYTTARCGYRAVPSRATFIFAR